MAEKSRVLQAIVPQRPPGARVEDRPGAPPSPEVAAWLAVVPVGVVFTAAALWLASPLSKLLFGSQATEFFDNPEVAYLVNPEPVELARFALAVVAALALAGSVPLLRSSLWRSLPQGWLDPMVIGVQLAGLVFLDQCWNAQAEAPDAGFIRTYFTDLDLVLASIVTGGIIVLVLSRHFPFPRATAEAGAGRRTRVLTAAAAAVVTGLWLLPAILNDYSVGLSSFFNVSSHLPVTLDEFMAVVNGRTPLVDFAAQYTSLLPYPALPVLSVFGYSVTTFTTMLSALSLVALFAVYLTLVHVTGSRWASLALYLPFVAISLFPLERPGDQQVTLANLYQILPLRYLGPFVVAWLCARHLRGLAPRRSAPIFLVAGLAALNNPEFGLPCVGATLVALWCAGSADASRRQGVRSLLTEVALGLVGALALVSALTLIRASSLPKPDVLLYYSNVFGVRGFGLLPMPTLGFHVIVFVTFVAALATAMVRRVSGASGEVLTGMLAYAAIFGMGASAYYAGRSLPIVLAALFPAWGLTVVLLTWTVLTGMRDRLRAGGAVLTRFLLPGLAVIFATALMAVTSTRFPPPWKEIERLTTSAESAPFDRSAAVGFVKRRASPGEPVTIVADHGFRIAESSGVQDTLPFNHYPDFIVSGDQLDLALRSLRDAGGSTIFTAEGIYPEVPAYLRKAGYAPKASDPHSGLTEWRPAD